MFKKYLLLFILITGCSGAVAHRNITVKLNNEIKEKKYHDALETVKSKKFYTKENSILLRNLEIGTVHYLKGDYYQALKHFDAAKSISDELYTISITNRTAEAWDSNLGNYYGERYERSLLRFYLSLVNYNIYKYGFYEEYTDKEGTTFPKKELNDDEKRTHLAASRSHILEWDSLLKSFRNESLGVPIYKDDMLAKTWGAFIHSQFGSQGERQIAMQLYRDGNTLLLRNYNTYSIFNKKSDEFNRDFKKLPTISMADLNKNYIEETIYSKELQKFLSDSLNKISKGKEDNVLFLIKDGLIAPKTVKTMQVPLLLEYFGSSGSDIFNFARTVTLVSNGVSYIEIEYPVIEAIGEINNYKVIVYGKEDNIIAKVDMALVEPTSHIAKKTLDDKFALLQARIVSRITAKYVTALTSAYLIYQQSDGNAFGQLAAFVAYKASIKVINESSRADIRYWSTLASNFQMGSVKLPNGKYRIDVIDEKENVVFKDELEVGNGVSFVDLNF